MPDPRRTWLASPHLRNDPDGAAGLTALDALPQSWQREILAATDSVAAHSVALAHRFFARAVPVAMSAADGNAGREDRYETALPDAARIWMRSALRLLGEGDGRELLQAWLQQPVEWVAILPAELVEAWVESARRLSGHSRRGAAELMTALATAMRRQRSAPPESGAPDATVTIESIRAWHRAVEEALAGNGWRGEVIALALGASAADLFGLLDSRGLELWVRLLSKTGSGGRTPRLPGVPAALLQLPPDRIASAMETVILRAGAGTEATEDLLRGLCEALAAFTETASEPILESVRHAVARAAATQAAATRAVESGEPTPTGAAGHRSATPPAGITAAAAAARRSRELRRRRPLDEAADLPAALHAAAAAAHALNPEESARLLQHAPAVAGCGTETLCAFLRSLGRALELGGPDGADLWVERGLELHRLHSSAVAPHFRLQTRTAYKLLRDHTAAVEFEEVETLLQRYVLMLSRRSFQILPSSGIWFRPPLTAPEDPALRLPERVDLFPSAEDNQLLYRLTTAHVAGRWEFGTYDFRLDRLLEDSAASIPESAADSERRDIVGFLDCFPNPLLAASLFTLLDGARVDAALSAAFPGLREDLQRLGTAYSASPPVAAADRPSERLLEALFLRTVGCCDGDALPARIRRQGRKLDPVLEVLRSPEADVYDSARLTAALYGGLSMAEVVAGEELDGDALGDLGGATFYEMAADMSGDGGGPEAAAGGDSPAASGEENLAPDGEGLDEPLQMEEETAPATIGSGMSAEELRALLEQGVEFKITQGSGKLTDALGLYATDLLGKLPQDVAEDLARRLAEGGASEARAWLARRHEGEAFLYDEWDHQIGDYRRQWCRLFETEGDGDAGRFFSRTITRRDDLIQALRREFLMMRPEEFRKIRGVEHGEDFDLNALVEAFADRRTKKTPTERLYIAKKREVRDVATMFLVDVSASTDEPLVSPETAADGPGSVSAAGSASAPPADETLRTESTLDAFRDASSAAPSSLMGPPGNAGSGSTRDFPEEPTRIIDLTKESLVILSSVLEEIGDAYAVYGFSGHGRSQVEFYQIKSFHERLSEPVRSRLGGMEPKRSTRMGTALRHAAQKLSRVSARSRHLILLSDGFPQDFDYGDDRNSNTYGIRDTWQALQELERAGVQTFCITVDPAGHDYLRDMCPTTRYAVIDNVAELPREVPRIYRSVTRE